MSTINEMFSALSDTWKSLGVIVACILLGASSAFYLGAYRDVPADIAELATGQREIRADVARIDARQESAEDDRRELRCLVIAGYRGSGLEACLEAD